MDFPPTTTTSYHRQQQPKQVNISSISSSSSSSTLNPFAKPFQLQAESTTPHKRTSPFQNAPPLQKVSPFHNANANVYNPFSGTTTTTTTDGSSKTPLVSSSKSVTPQRIPRRETGPFLGAPLLNREHPIYPFETQNQDLTRKLVWTTTAMLKQFFKDNKMVLYKIGYPGDENIITVCGYRVVIVDMEQYEPDLGAFCLTASIDTTNVLHNSPVRKSMNKLKMVRHKLSHQQFTVGVSSCDFSRAVSYCVQIADGLMALSGANTRLQDFIEMKKRVVIGLQNTYHELKEMRENRERVSKVVNEYNKARLVREMLQSDSMQKDEVIHFLLHELLPRSKDLMDKIIPAETKKR